MRLALVFVTCLLLIDLVKAKAPEIRRGTFDAVFTERCPESNLKNIFKRMQHKPRTNRSLGNDYQMDEESFYVYVPSDYVEDKSFGLLVWISAGESGRMPEAWSKMMDKYKLIWIGAHRSGNKHSVPGRRMALALDAVHNIKVMYNIDPNRVYVSGISGGGRVASILAIHYPDVFSGGIFVAGVECWEPIEVTGRPEQFYRPMPKPQSKYLTMAKERGRYVLLTGDEDFNRAQTHDYYEKGYRKSLKHVLYIQVPGMGHELPPAEWYEKALVFLDTIRVSPTK